MELTDEMIEYAIVGGYKDFEPDYPGVIQMLATALKAERAKPKVWDGAPDGADCVELYYRKMSAGYYDTKPVVRYTRELPKSRERLIAEKYGGSLIITNYIDTTRQNAINIIEAAIHEAKGDTSNEC